MNEQNKQIPIEAVEGKVVLRSQENVQIESGEKGLTIRRGKVDSLIIYEVTEAELETIERGSPSSTFFNIGVALLTLAASFFTTLVTVDLKLRPQLFTLFLLLTIIGFVAGSILMILWSQSKNDVSNVIKSIRNRVVE